MKYQINDTVLYAANGICKITEITKQEFCGEYKEYYTLKPLYDTRSTIDVPLNNEVLTGKMRRVLCVEEIYDLIRRMPHENEIWIEEEVVRKVRYKEILGRGDPSELVRLIKTLHHHQEKQ